MGDVMDLILLHVNERKRINAVKFLHSTLLSILYMILFSINVP